MVESGAGSDHGYGTKFLTGVLGLGLGAALAGGITWRRSPWPSVWLLRQMGKRADSDQPERLVANEALVPAGVVMRALDRRYGEAPANTLDVFTPDSTGTHPTLIWVHGGGFVGGTKDDVRGYLKVMAAEGITTVGIEYTLAPTAKYPTPVLELAKALEYLIAHADELGVDTDRLVLAGDSAGAHIAAQAAFAIFDPDYANAAGLPRPVPPETVRSLVLTSGVYDLTLGSNASGLAGWLVRTILWAYSGDRRPIRNGGFEHASLIDHVPNGLPPTYLTAGNDDPLRPHTTRLARALEQAGVKVFDDVVAKDFKPPMTHDYQMDLRFERARESMAQIVDLVRSTTG